MHIINLTDNEVKALVSALSFSLRDKMGITTASELIQGDLKFKLKRLINE